MRVFRNPKWSHSTSFCPSPIERPRTTNGLSVPLATALLCRMTIGTVGSGTGTSPRHVTTCMHHSTVDTTKQASTHHY